MGKGVLGAREWGRTRREGGREEGNACQENIVFAIPPSNYVCKNNATVNDYLANTCGHDALIFQLFSALGTNQKVLGGGGGPDHLEMWLIKNTWPYPSLRYKND